MILLILSWLLVAWCSMAGLVCLWISLCYLAMRYSQWTEERRIKKIIKANALKVIRGERKPLIWIEKVGSK